MARTWKGYVKKQAKRAWGASKRFIKKRYLSKGGFANVVKDVKMLKSVINSEKLRYTYTPNSAVGVGQTTGAYLQDVSPYPSQGDTISSRTGSSIRLHSSNIRFQISQQASTFTAVKLKVMLIQIMGPQRTDTSAILSQMFLANPFNGLIDFNSSRNPDYMRDFKVLRQTVFTLPNDQASIATQTTLIDKRIGMKYKNYHVRFNQNSNTNSSGQMYLLIIADVGNASGVVTTPTNVITNAINTGAYVNYFVDHYYYDN